MAYELDSNEMDNTGCGDIAGRALADRRYGLKISLDLRATWIALRRFGSNPSSCGETGVARRLTT